MCKLSQILILTILQLLIYDCWNVFGATSRPFPWKTLADLNAAGAGGGPWGCDRKMEGLRLNVSASDGNYTVFFIHEKWAAAYFAVGVKSPGYIWMGTHDPSGLKVESESSVVDKGPCEVWFLK